MTSTLDFGAHIRHESAAFARALRPADPASVVPSCPGWTAADLLWHLCEVQYFWTSIVRDRMADPAGYVEPSRPDRYDDLADRFDEATEALVGALEDAGDGEQVWTWFEPDQTVGFVRRRQAHEALIHRLDAELIGGQLGPVDQDLATDGIDEVLRCYFSGAPTWSTVATDGPQGRISTTDTEASWSVRVDRFSGTSPTTGTTYVGEPVLDVGGEGGGDFTVSGRAADLDAWLWNRGGAETVVRTGDTAALEALVSSGLD